MLHFPSSFTQVVTLFLVLSPVLVVSVQGHSTLHQRATVCNGHSELCSRGYGSLTYVGAHDSYAIGTNNLAVNQDQSITTQLNDGIRMLQMQAHLQKGVIKLCHSSCALYDGGTLQDYLKKVKTWMDANPNEVLSLLIVNINNLNAAQYDSVFKSAGVDVLSYTPSSTPLQASAWPTLGSMIDSGKRLVTFLDNGADPTVAPYLIDEFTHVWETAYDVTDPNLFDCNVNRTKGDTSTQMYLINHFLDKFIFGQPAPDIDNANVTNAATGFGSLGAHIDSCVSAHGRSPNFLLVDFYEYGGGSVFQVAANINNVTYNPTTPVAQPVLSSSSSAPTVTATGSHGNNALPQATDVLPALLIVIPALIAGGSFLL